MSALASYTTEFPRAPYYQAATRSGTADIIDFSRYSSSTSRQSEYPHWTAHFVNRINALLAVQSLKGSVNGVFLSLEIVYKAAHFLGALMAGSKRETPIIALNDQGFLVFEWDNDPRFLTITLMPGGELSYSYEDGQRELEGNTHDVRVLKELMDNF